MKGRGGESGGGGWRREGGVRPQAEAGRDWYTKRAGASISQTVYMTFT